MAPDSAGGTHCHCTGLMAKGPAEAELKVVDAGVQLTYDAHQGQAHKPEGPCAEWVDAPQDGRDVGAQHLVIL